MIHHQNIARLKRFSGKATLSWKQNEPLCDYRKMQQVLGYFEHNLWIDRSFYNSRSHRNGMTSIFFLTEEFNKTYNVTVVHESIILRIIDSSVNSFILTRFLAGQGLGWLIFSGKWIMGWSYSISCDVGNWGGWLEIKKHLNINLLQPFPFQ